MHVRYTTILSKHNQHIDAETILAGRNQFLCQVFNQALKFRINWGVVFDGKKKFTDSVAL
jgi:hypothetical protein